VFKEERTGEERRSVGASATPGTKERRRGEERKPNPNLGSVYHVMNSTCIYLRAKGLNIYMYRRGEYTKNPIEKYNNRKS
jgi:hypothetical protein